MKVYCYPKCTTCKKALKWLDDNGVSYELIDIAKDNPSYEDLKAYYEKSQLDIKKFFNTSGLKYKELGLKDKLKEMTEEEKLQLLATDGMLVKRPLVVADDFVVTGFKEADWAAKLGIQL